MVTSKSRKKFFSILLSSLVACTVFASISPVSFADEGLETVAAVTTIAAATVTIINEAPKAIESVSKAWDAVVDTVKEGIEYNAKHPSDPSNPWFID